VVTFLENPNYRLRFLFNIIFSMETLSRQSSILLFPFHPKNSSSMVREICKNILAA
jgi:hypothetical protein